MLADGSSDFEMYAETGDWRCLSCGDHLKALKYQAVNGDQPGKVQGFIGFKPPLIPKQGLLGNEAAFWADRAGDQAVPLLRQLADEKGIERVQKLLRALALATTRHDHVHDPDEPWWMASTWAKENRHSLGDYMTEVFA